jgi:hypothetical protein
LKIPIVLSNLDTEENDLIDRSTYLRIDSSEESDNNNDDLSTSALAIGSAWSGSDSENDDDPVDSTCPTTANIERRLNKDAQTPRYVNGGEKKQN